MCDLVINNFTIYYLDIPDDVQKTETCDNISINTIIKNEQLWLTDILYASNANNRMDHLRRKSDNW